MELLATTLAAFVGSLVGAVVLQIMFRDDEQETVIEQRTPTQQVITKRRKPKKPKKSGNLLINGKTLAQIKQEQSGDYPDDPAA